MTKCVFYEFAILQILPTHIFSKKKIFAQSKKRFSLPLFPTPRSFQKIKKLFQIILIKILH